MKNIYLILLLMGGILFSCEPNKNIESIGGEYSEQDIDIIVEPLIVKNKEGKEIRSNKIIVENKSLINGYWDAGTEVSPKMRDTLLVVLSGERNIKFFAVSPNGKIVEKTVKVTVDELFFEVPLAWSYLCGEGARNWTWNTNDFPKPYGTAGYGNNDAPGWSTFAPGDVVSGKTITVGEEMQFALDDDGPKFRRLKGGVVLEEGSFSFDMSKKKIKANETAWSIGEISFRTASVFVPYGTWVDPKTSDPIYKFDIIKLENGELRLAWAAEGTLFEEWAECTFWCFMPVE